MSPSDINPDLCQARLLPGAVVIGYTPKVYREAQCWHNKIEGNLCTDCNDKRKRATALGENHHCYRQGFPRWFGLITEDPFPTCHMLGTAWANNKVKKVDVESESESESESNAPPVPAPAPAPAQSPALVVSEIPTATEELIAMRQEMAAMRQELDAVRQELIAMRQELAGIVSRNKVVVEVRLA